MIKTILVPVDLSEADKGAHVVNAAKGLAQAHGAKLVLLHVVSDVPAYVAAQMPADVPSKMVDDARSGLKELAADQGLGDENCETKVRTGQITSEILASAKKLGADLIVMGSHDPTITDYLLGSVASRVVNHAPISVYVVRKT